MRVALGCVPITEAELVSFVAFVDAAEAPADLELVVPALDHVATALRLDVLLGDLRGRVDVEPVFDYLERGHDIAALVDDDPAVRGRQAAGAARGQRIDNPSPPVVVAWLARQLPMALPKELDERPDHRVPAVVGVGDHRVVVRTSWGTSLVALGTDGHGPDLVMPEVYDPETVHAATRSVHPGDIALDAGAGIGAITVQLARSVGHRGRVVAVEPDEQAHALLLENLALNGVTDWVDAATEWSALDAVLAGDTQIALLRTSGYAATLAALDRAESAILARRVRRLLVRTDSVVAHRDAPEVLARFDHYRRWLGASFSRVSVNGTAVATTVEGLASSDDDRAVLVDLVPSA